MKVVISTDGPDVSTHFGRCPSFTVLEIEDGRIISNKEIPNPGHEPGFLPNFFHEMGVQCIIAGGMGGRASELFAQFQIQPIVGVTGSIQDVIAQLQNGTLKGGESLCQGHGSGPGGGSGKCDHNDSECQHS